MTDKFYQDQWASHLDCTYDAEFQRITLNGLSWLPWVGNQYEKSIDRLLIVGESHYTNAKDETSVAESKQSWSSNKHSTREVIAEYPLIGYEAGWKNNAGRANCPTFDNLHRMFLQTALLDSNDKDKRSRFWREVAYYNFVQKMMDYGADRPKERPDYNDFYNGWRLWIEVVKIIKPKYCVFLGVSASNSFNQAMRDLGVEYRPVEWGEPLNRVYLRKNAAIIIDGEEIKIFFTQHPSNYLSWDLWHKYLSSMIPEVVNRLNTIVLQGVLTDETHNLQERMPIDECNMALTDLPRHLQHKPIIACKYGNGFGDQSEDVKYLSIGKAQYNQDSASVKAIRHSGVRWSRQSEEVPIHRIGYMMQLLLSSILIVQSNDMPKQSSLREEIAVPGELEFLKTQFHANREEIIASIMEIKNMLSQIDIQKI